MPPREPVPQRRGTPPPPAADDFGPPLRGDQPRPAAPVRRREAPPATPNRRPAKARSPRRRRSALRALRTVLAVVLVLALLAVGSIVALGAYATVSLDRVQVGGLTGSTNGITNVLLVGSDSREGLTPEQLQALGTDAVSGQRTDSILLLSVRGGSAAILAFPRDLYVSRCDGSNGRINGAYSTGGATCLTQTVAQISGIPVNHYMEVDFAGFVDLVDATGGVKLFLDQPMVDASAGVNLPQGCNLLDGRSSLGFVRARYVDSDLGRIARQQRFLSELADAVVQPSTLLNPLRLFRVTGAGARALTADQGLGLLDLARLARAGRGLAAGGLATYTVPTTGDTIGGAAVQVPTDEADAVFARFASGAVLDVPTGGAGGALQPSDIVVDVLNGAGVSGLAARGAEVMSSRGFTVGEIGNAEEVPRTVVRYGPGNEQAAQTVASQLPGVLTEAAAAGDSDLALVLGSDAENLFNAPAPPPATAAPAPAPQPAPDQAPEPGASAVEAIGAGEVPETC